MRSGHGLLPSQSQDMLRQVSQCSKHASDTGTVLTSETTDIVVMAAMRMASLATGFEGYRPRLRCLGNSLS